MNKNLLPYDIYERHKKVASFIRHNESILDVGGELNHLSQFTKDNRVVVANLKSGDIIISKKKLPFTKNSFDIVCAIDVLEHIARNKRRLFISELARVASGKIIISVPLGNTQHIEYEKKIQHWLQEKQLDVRYLKEHLHYGLPNQSEIDSLIKYYNSKVYYSGDIIFNGLLFKIFLFDPKTKVLRHLVYFTKLAFNFFTNPIFYLYLIDKQYSTTVNRAYIVISKSSKNTA